MPARNPRKSKSNDVISLLKEDHKKVKALLEDMSTGEDSNAEELRELCEQVEHELKVHTEIEEKLVYPIFQSQAEDTEDHELFIEAAEEHQIVDLVIEHLKKADPGSPSFHARARVLEDLVRHHIKEEEKEMLPRLRKLVDEQQFEEIGARMLQMKEQLQPAMAIHRH